MSLRSALLAGICRKSLLCNVAELRTEDMWSYISPMIIRLAVRIFGRRVVKHRYCWLEIVAAKIACRPHTQ